MALNVTFEDLKKPHFTENLNAYIKLKNSGTFTEEELDELFWKQMELDELEEGDNNA